MILPKTQVQKRLCNQSERKYDTVKVSNITSYQKLQTTKNNQQKYREISFSGKSPYIPKKLGLLSMAVISILSGCAKPALESDLAKMFRFKSPRLLKMFEKPKEGYELIDGFRLKAKEIGEVESTSFENAIVKKTKELFNVDDKTKTFTYTYRDKRKVADDFSVAPTITINPSTNVVKTSSSSTSTSTTSPSVSFGVTFVNSDIYNVFDVTKTYEDVAPKVGQVFVTKGKNGNPNFSSSQIDLYGKLVKTTETFAGSKTETSSTTTVNFPSSSTLLDLDD